MALATWPRQFFDSITSTVSNLAIVPQYVPRIKDRSKNNEAVIINATNTFVTKRVLEEKRNGFFTEKFPDGTTAFERIAKEYLLYYTETSGRLYEDSVFNFEESDFQTNLPTINNFNRIHFVSSEDLKRIIELIIRDNFQQLYLLADPAAYILSPYFQLKIQQLLLSKLPNINSYRGLAYINSDQKHIPIHQALLALSRHILLFMSLQVINQDDFFNPYNPNYFGFIPTIESKLIEMFGIKSAHSVEFNKAIVNEEIDRSLILELCRRVIIGEKALYNYNDPHHLNLRARIEKFRYPHLLEETIWEFAQFVRTNYEAYGSLEHNSYENIFNLSEQ